MLTLVIVVAGDLADLDLPAPSIGGAPHERQRVAIVGGLHVHYADGNNGRSAVGVCRITVDKWKTIGAWCTRTPQRTSLQKKAPYATPTYRRVM